MKNALAVVSEGSDRELKLTTPERRNGDESVASRITRCRGR